MGETSPLEFKFLMADEASRGSYVKVKDGSKDWIFAQVVEVTRSNVAYSLNSIDEENREAKERLVGFARVIGVASGGKLAMPTIPPKPGDPVLRADADLMERALGLSKGNLYIGLLDGHDLKVRLDADSFVQKHCSILAKTGSGKSYTAAVVLEELLEKGVALLIIDPHGEYASMKQKNAKGDFVKFDVKPRGYDVTVYSPASQMAAPTADRFFRFNGKNLTAREISAMLPEDVTNSQRGVLYEAIKILASDGGNYELEDVISQAEKDTSKAKWGLIGHLEALEELGIFSGKATDLGALLQRGKASVIDMTGVPPDLQGMIVAKLLSDLFEARKRGLVNPGMVVVEEAHNYIPERGSGKAASTTVIRTIAAEGRKFGLGLLVISQRPARVDKNVISQCNTQIILRVTNPNDLRALSKGIEGMSSELEEEIKRLPPGTAMLVSSEIEHPVTVKIRPRKSRHGGVSTPIVGGGKAKAAAGPNSGAKPVTPRPRGAEAGGDSGSKIEKRETGGGFLRKILGK
ncbi:MAG TPA: ATP-binding protein [Methanothrix sp.]|nr:ATP-binding protein [Methanothrix sp.]HRW82478.1 ATP-binding protein [Methanothrix sp.]